jgi:hypothetical protein
MLEYCLQLHRQFSTTKFGASLRNKIRFRRFKPPLMTDAEWQLLLGPDVNNLDHLQLSIMQTWDYMQAAPDVGVGLSTQEAAALLLAACVHDWQEAVVEDVPDPSKTASSHQSEIQLLYHIIDEVLPPDTNKLEREAARIVLENTQSRLAKIFRQIEIHGYLTTGTAAWELRHAVHQRYTDDLASFGTRTFTFDLPKLLTDDLHNRPFRPYLREHAASFNEIAAQSIDVVKDYPPAGDDTVDKLVIYHIKFVAAQRLWSKYKP